MAATLLPVAGRALAAAMRGLMALAAVAAMAQTAPQAGFKQAGSCARCHVAATLEWSVSGHVRAGTDCVACHGASVGHVTDERNGIKPERVPHGADIARLCRTCHANQKRDGCESCHHIHALLHPNTKAPATAPAADPAERYLAEGERLIAARNWSGARAQFEEALRAAPRNRRAAARLAFVKRRQNPAMAGFEPLDGAVDPESGLPLRVRVSGMPVEMVLIPSGDADLGEGAQAHTVPVAAFYLARTEVTQAVWAAIENENPSAPVGAQLPVNNVSWNDAQGWIARLNARVPGGGFRLPTEAEWEFAAPAGEPGARAWYRTEVQTAAFRELNAYAPRAVATRAADGRGLYDVAGNVWEWCSSLLRPYPYDPSDGRESPDAPGLRVLRGGGYADSADYLRRSFRHGERPGRRLPFNGFRLARSAPPPQ